MRTMRHNSRTNARGRVHGVKHNDRNFDVSKADNIDSEKSKNNIYENVYNADMTFEEVELKFYEENFGEQLKKVNENYIKNRHPERVKTMAEWKKNKRNCPEETTIQIGKLEEHIDSSQLTECYKEYAKQLEAWNQAHGNPFTVLTRALHTDEAVSHWQERKVWHYKNKAGDLCVGQERALKAAGVPLPHPDKPEGRRNNRKMTFDAMAREMWLNICWEHGIEVEREALPDGRGKKSLDKEDMIRQKYDKLLQEVEELQAELKDRQQDLWISPAVEQIESKKSWLRKGYSLVRTDNLELVLKAVNKLTAVRNALIDSNNAYKTQNAEFERLRATERAIRQDREKQKRLRLQNEDKAKQFDEVLQYLQHEGLDINQVLKAAKELQAYNLQKSRGGREI